MMCDVTSDERSLHERNRNSFVEVKKICIKLVFNVDTKCGDVPELKLDTYLLFRLSGVARMISSVWRQASGGRRQVKGKEAHENEKEEGGDREEMHHADCGWRILLRRHSEQQRQTTNRKYRNL